MDQTCLSFCSSQVCSGEMWAFCLHWSTTFTTGVTSHGGLKPEGVDRQLNSPPLAPPASEDTLEENLKSHVARRSTRKGLP